MKPREYQHAAVKSIFDYFTSGKTGNPIVAMPTGVGKSIVIGEFVRQAFEQYPYTRIMKLTHSKELIEQNLNKLLAIWPTAPAGVYSSGLKRKESSFPITFGGIGSVAKQNLSKFGRIDLLLIDECHLVSPSESTQYRKVIDALKEINPYLKVIGFTATHYRLGQGMLTDPGGLFTDICFDATTLESFNWFVSEGFLAPLIPKRTKTELDVSGVHKSGGEYKQNELQDAVDINSVTMAAVQEMIEFGEDRRCWLIFASGIEHTIHVNEMLNRLGVASTFVHSKMPSLARDANLLDFKAGKYRAIVNNGILCLDAETEILGKDGWIGMEEMSYSHHVASYHLDGKITFAPPKFIIKRDLLPGEKFIVGEGRNMGYRVTDNHRMLVKWQGDHPWKVLPASELVGNTHYRYPVSGHAVPSLAIPLTMDECSFLGFWFGDGTLYKRTSTQGHGWECSLSQSNVNSFIVNWIDELLERLQMKHSRSEVRSNNSVRWTINRPSYVKLLPYLNKQGSSELLDLTENQLGAILHGFWMADGNHYSGESVSKEGWCITGVQKELYDKLQAVGVTRGYRVTITAKAAPKKEHWKQQYTIRWAKATESSLTQIRAPYSERLETDTRTWCITSDTGFIVTRRKGRVTVVGNTTGFDHPPVDLIGMLRPTQSPSLWVQMLGRGTRPNYAKGYDLNETEGRLEAMANSSKQNCLVLDFAGNTKRLGPINDVVLPKTKGEKGGGTAPVKVCEACGVYNHASVRFCMNCGHEFPKQVKIVNSAGTDVLIATNASVAPVTETFKVDRVTYARHDKVDRPPSIKISYYCGLRVFHGYLCLEHEGFAKKKARDLWRERSDLPPPETTAEAFELLNGLMTPTHIRVWLKSGQTHKYDEILSYIYNDEADHEPQND